MRHLTSRRALLLASAGTVALRSLLANPANGDRRLELLFSSYIAPCCWRENLLVHQSPKADELRAAIRRLVAEGRSDEEIKVLLVSQYSRRILSSPEGVLGQWLSWTPVLAVAAGLGAVALTLQRLKRTAAPGPDVSPADIPDSEWDWDSTRARR